MRYLLESIGNVWDRSGGSALTALPSYVMVTVVGPAQSRAYAPSQPASNRAPLSSTMAFLRWWRGLHRQRLPG